MGTRDITLGGGDSEKTKKNAKKSENSEGLRKGRFGGYEKTEGTGEEGGKTRSP